MPKKKTVAEKIAEIPIEDVARLSGKSGRKQLESYVRKLQAGYKRRVGSFKRKDLVSYAQISLEKSLPKRKPVQLTKMTRNQLLLEFARYSKFFSDVTSTEEGIRKVNKEQDLRIFGEDGKGRPVRKMTSSEREDYWDLYDEFYNQFKDDKAKYSSETVQQMLGDAVFGDYLNEDGYISPNVDLQKFLDKVAEKVLNKQRNENIRSVPNVYSGRGNNS